MEFAVVPVGVHGERLVSARLAESDHGVAARHPAVIAGFLERQQYRPDRRVGRHWDIRLNSSEARVRLRDVEAKLRDVREGADGRPRQIGVRVDRLRVGVGGEVHERLRHG